MSTVTFSNGKSVTFNGTPTSADIDQVASQFGGTSAAPSASSASSTAPAATPASVGMGMGSTPDPSVGMSNTPSEGAWSKLADGASHLLSNLETPLTSVAATPVQLIAKALGRPDPYAKGIPEGLPGDTSNVPVAPVTGAGILQKVGQAGEVATSAYGAGAAGMGPLIATGALNGLSQSLASGTETPGSLIGNTVFGGLAGAGAGILGELGTFFANAEKSKIGISGAIEPSVKSLTDSAVSDVASGADSAKSELLDSLNPELADKTQGGQAPGDPATPAQVPQIAANIANQISNTDPSLLAHYIDTTAAHAENMRAPTPVQIAENAMTKRAGIFMNQVLPAAGKAVGAAKEAARSLPIALADAGTGAISSGKDAAQSIFADVAQKVQEMTKHSFSQIANSGFDGGNTPVLAQIPGSSVELNSAEQKQLMGVYNALDGLTNHNPTVGEALDQITNMRKSLGSAVKSNAMDTSSPVVGAVKYAIGALKSAVNTASPDVAAANTTFSDLKNLQEGIKTNAGGDLQSANLMMRRVVAGDKSGHVIPILDQLDAVTKPFIKTSDMLKDPELQGDLVQHAILSKWATDQFGDESTKTMLQGYAGAKNEVTKAANILEYPKKVFQGIAGKTLSIVSPNAKEYAMSLAKGEPQGMEPIARIIDKWAASSEGTPVVGGIISNLRQMGVTAKNAEEKIALPLLKTYLMNNINNVNTGFRAQMSQKGTHSAMIPADVPQQIAPPPASVAPATRSLTQAATNAVPSLTNPTQ